jgi:hypothetical protein
MSTQPYIKGSRVHAEQLRMNYRGWNVYMCDVAGYPILRELTEQEANEIVDKINSGQISELKVLI